MGTIYNKRSGFRRALFYICFGSSRTAVGLGGAELRHPLCRFPVGDPRVAEPGRHQNRDDHADNPAADRAELGPLGVQQLAEAVERIASLTTQPIITADAGCSRSSVGSSGRLTAPGPSRRNYMVQATAACDEPQMVLAAALIS